MRIDEQMIEDYATIVLRQETGMNVFGEIVERYQDGDREFMKLVEDNVNLDEFSLDAAVESKFEAQQDYIKESKNT